MWRLSRYWIYWAAWASITGWGLSVVHLLNGTGYLLAALAPLIALGCIFYWHPEAFRSRRTPGPFIASWSRGLRRRPLQLGFALMALLIFISGSLYVPWSFDAESYRLPRILYWWTHNGWFWLNPPDNRLDYSSVGFEWEMLPVILLTRTDRFLFLLNWIPFLFLPALLLQFLRMFDVRRALIRVLIWVIPSGYCYALQAGSIQNDGYATLYLLAAFVFLHSPPAARENERFGHLAPGRGPADRRKVVQHFPAAPVWRGAFSGTLEKPEIDTDLPGGGDSRRGGISRSLDGTLLFLHGRPDRRSPESAVEQDDTPCRHHGRQSHPDVSGCDPAACRPVLEPALGTLLFVV